MDTAGLSQGLQYDVCVLVIVLQLDNDAGVSGG